MKNKHTLLEFITNCIERKGESPTIKEMKDALGANSISSIQRNLEALESEGYIRRGKGWRSITLGITESTREPETIPLLGYVAAGNPIEAVLIPETIAVPKDMVQQRKNCFALRVRGESMIDENIVDGDVVVLEPVSVPRNGQIVVALVDNCEATVKIFRQKENIVELIPANRKYQTIRVESHRVTIQGGLIGLIRHY